MSEETFNSVFRICVAIFGCGFTAMCTGWFIGSALEAVREWRKGDKK